MRSNTSRPPFSQYLCTELILSKSDSFYVKAVDLDDYHTACAVNKSFLILYFFKIVYRILGSPVIVKNNMFHRFNMNILNRFIFGIVIVNISLCELPEILQLNPAYIHSSAFRIKSMILSNERSLSTYASYNACFALSIFRSTVRRSYCSRFRLIAFSVFAIFCSSVSLFMFLAIYILNLIWMTSRNSIISDGPRKPHTVI